MILDGKIEAKKIKEKLKQKIEKMNKKPSLAIVTVGHNEASESYVRGKIKACEQVGIRVTNFVFSETVEESDLIAMIKGIKFDGIIVQLPLPDKFDERRVLDSIDSSKDVDGLTTENIGKLYAGKKCFIPCTPKGILHLTKTVYEDLTGKKVVIVGRSNLVGKPVAELFLRENCTVKLCHSKTKNLKDEIKDCNILVVAVGKPHLISDNETNAKVIIDVGVNRVDGKLVGDVEIINDKAYITPVPGGVGPMTVAMLLENVVEGART